MREAHANACRAGDAMGSRSVDRVGVCYCLLTIYHSGGSYISRAFQPQIAFLCFISPQGSSHCEEHGTEWLLQQTRESSTLPRGVRAVTTSPTDHLIYWR